MFWIFSDLRVASAQFIQNVTSTLSMKGSHFDGAEQNDCSLRQKSLNNGVVCDEKRGCGPNCQNPFKEFRDDFDEARESEQRFELWISKFFSFEFILQVE